MDDPPSAIAIGAAVRLTAILLFGKHVKLAAIIAGLCNGVGIHRSLRLSRRPSGEPFLQPAATIAVDLLTTRSPAHIVVIAMGCVLGLLLADIAPEVWYTESRALQRGKGRRRRSENMRRPLRSPSSREVQRPPLDLDAMPTPKLQAPRVTTLHPLPAVLTVYDSETQSPFTSLSPPNTSTTTTQLARTTRLPANTDSRSCESLTLTRRSDITPPVDDEDQGTPRARPVDAALALNADVPVIELDSPITLAMNPFTQIVVDMLSPSTPRVSIPRLEVVDAPLPEPEMHLGHLDCDYAPVPETLMPLSHSPASTPDDGSDHESLASALESVISDGSRSALIRRAEVIRTEAVVLSKSIPALEDGRRKAQAENKHFDAFTLKLQKEDVEEEAQRLHRKAERRFFAAHNRDLSEPFTIDLHRLNLKEATKHTEDAMRKLQLSGHERLRVIVGRGKHSTHPVLKFGIMKRMNAQRIPCEVDKKNPGLLNITIRPVGRS